MTSKRIRWVAIAVAVLIALTVIVYSRQTSQNQAVQVVGAQTPALQAQKPANPKPSTEVNKAAAKAPCKLTTAHAPNVGGVKLGLTPEQILAVFPGSAEDAGVKADVGRPASQFGSKDFIITPQKFSTKPEFAGVKHIVFNVFDGKVSSFNIGYNGPEWKNIDDFVNQFAGNHFLPNAESWDPFTGMDKLKTLKCEGFEVAVFAGGKGGNSNYVKVKDLKAETDLKGRRDKAIEKAMKEAKP